MKKIKLKKTVKKFLTYILIGIIIIIAISKIYNVYQQKQYEKTYEYKLISLGYKKEEANLLTKKYKNKELAYILDKKKNSFYLEIINQEYFIYDNFYKYLDYYEESEEDLKKVIEKVNTNTYKDYYEDVKKADTTKNELILVNKYYSLSEDYVPKDLVVIPTTYAWGKLGDQQVTKTTYDNYLKMWKASSEAGFYLMVSSSYRTYEKQESVYSKYKKDRGERYADSIAARAGHSEHQTGLCLDIFEKGSTQQSFQDTESYKWLKNNSYKYGFIERYPLNKEDVTGYSYESWHYRYVGVEAATYIYEHNITFDEYYAYFVK